MTPDAQSFSGPLAARCRTAARHNARCAGAAELAIEQSLWVIEWDSSEVGGRIDRLARSRRESAVFGAIGHGFRRQRRLRPPAKVAQLERQWNFTAPPDYRTFLLEVEAGGAGPGYGLFSFGTWGGEPFTPAWPDGDPSVAFPHDSSPSTNTWREVTPPTKNRKRIRATAAPLHTSSQLGSLTATFCSWGAADRTYGHPRALLPIACAFEMVAWRGV